MISPVGTGVNGASKATALRILSAQEMRAVATSGRGVCVAEAQRESGSSRAPTSNGVGDAGGEEENQRARGFRSSAHVTPER